jgi:dTMP kinase
MAGKTFFIVIEGIDGSGKSSVTRRLVRVLEATLGRHVKLTFEPHDPSCAGLFIRQVLMKKITNIPARTLALAFATNRADHCDREIVPFLEQVNGKNRVVICDRYYLSSLVYQKTEDFGFEEIMSLNTSAKRPDLTLFLTATSKTCYERMRNRGEDKELFEVNLNEIRKRYFEAIEFLRNKGDKILTVESEGTLQEVFEKVKHVVFENAPEWLRVQNDLPIDEYETIFVQSELSIEKTVDDLIKCLVKTDKLITKIKSSEMNQVVYPEVVKYLDNLKYDDVATLFLNALSLAGYSLHEKLPWTDLDAFELSYTMPLGVTQRGTALLLGESQRYDFVITKLLGSQKYQLVGSMSDFLFIFDSNPCHLRINYYEREKLMNGLSQKISPMLCVIGRTELADIITAEIINKFINKS